MESLKTKFMYEDWISNNRFLFKGRIMIGPKDDILVPIIVYKGKFICVVFVDSLSHSILCSDLERNMGYHSSNALTYSFFASYHHFIFYINNGYRARNYTKKINLNIIWN